MSGGVDSSTVAAIMRDAGYEVIGVTLKLCASFDANDAKLVCNVIGAEHHVLDLETDFKKIVEGYFIDTYAKGRTPIPCVKCNQMIKFGLLYEFAMKIGADYLATGHYAQILHANDKAELHKASDLSKDQSYFLFAVDRNKLQKMLFPLGKMKKPDVRKLAHSYNLPVADKAESQNITGCLVPSGKYVHVIEQHIKSVPGEIVDTHGTVLGTHKGFINYTIGQRRGIGLSGTDNPYYVVKLDADNNRVVVGLESDLSDDEFYIENTNWLTDESLILDKPVTVKIRSTHPGTTAIITADSNRKSYMVKLVEKCKSITPGQACVVYSGTQVLGGGLIV